MVCEAVPGAKGAQRRRKVFNTLSYLTSSDTDFQPCNIFTLLLVTVTAHKPHSVLRAYQFPVKMLLCYVQNTHTHVCSSVVSNWSDCGVPEGVECYTTICLQGCDEVVL